MNSHTPLLVLALAGVAGYVGCGGTVGFDGSPPGPGEPGYDAGSDARHVGSIVDGGSVVVVNDGGLVDDASSTYVDPSCPNSPPAKTQYTCDVGKQTGCLPKEACYPYVQYPSAPCEAEIYGSVCVPAGTGTQGSSCGSSQGSCAAGFICVIAGSGNQCARACDLNKPNACAGGLVCDPIDVAGIGVCN